MNNIAGCSIDSSCQQSRKERKKGEREREREGEGKGAESKRVGHKLGWGLLHGTHSRAIYAPHCQQLLLVYSIVLKEEGERWGGE